MPVSLRTAEPTVPEGFKETEIGLIPAEWEIEPLEKISEVITGRTPSTKETRYWDNGTIPFITPADLRSGPIRGAARTITEDALEASRPLSRGTVAVSCIGYIGKVGVIDAPVAVTNQQINAVIPREDQADNWYLAYAMMHLEPLLNDRARVTTVPILNKSNFQRIPVPLPPLPEQRRIAHVLGTIHQAIAAQDDLIAAAREVKRSLMQRLFTYGPGPEPAPTKETEVGEMPEHWEVVQLGEMAELKNGINFRSDQKGRGVLTVDVLNMYVGGIAVEMGNLYRVGVDLGEQYILQPNDVLLVRSSLKQEGVGWPALFPGYKEPVTFCGFLIRVRLTSDAMLPEFLVNYLRLPSTRRLLVSKSGKVAITNINQGNVKSLDVCIPPLQEQGEIIRHLRVVDAKIAAEEQRKAALQALFKTMLHQLMTGQIRLTQSRGDAEAQSGL